MLPEACGRFTHFETDVLNGIAILGFKATRGTVGSRRGPRFSPLQPGATAGATVTPAAIHFNSWLQFKSLPS
jgi:hypothetical protein